MATSQSGETKRKKTGGRRRAAKKKQKHELGGIPALPTIGETLREKTRTVGKGIKLKAKYLQEANVYDPATKKYMKAKMLTERDNPANRNYPRMNILTKGAVVDTDIGTIKITSRPGQHGVANAILIEAKKK